MKQKLFLDFDSVIVDTISAYCKTYSTIYDQATGFREPDPNKVNRWDLSDECALEKNPLHIFGMGYFFLQLEFMSDAPEVITKLSEKYDIVICSIGTYDNLSHKSEWINKNLPFADAILLKTKGNQMNKSAVDMSGAIFIDDHMDNLVSSNAETKICFGKKYPWNEKWEGTTTDTWNDVAKLLL